MARSMARSIVRTRDKTRWFSPVSRGRAVTRPSLMQLQWHGMQSKRCIGGNSSCSATRLGGKSTTAPAACSEVVESTPDVRVASAMRPCWRSDARFGRDELVGRSVLRRPTFGDESVSVLRRPTFGLAVLGFPRRLEDREARRARETHNSQQSAASSGQPTCSCHANMSPWQRPWQRSWQRPQQHGSDYVTMAATMAAKMAATAAAWQ